MSQEPMSLPRVCLQPPARTRPQEPAAAAPWVQASRPVVFLGAGYLALLAAAEVLATMAAAAVPWVGLLVYGAVLLLLLLHTALCLDRPWRCLPGLLAGAPLLRLALLLLGPAGLSPLCRSLALGLPALAAGGSPS